MIEFKTGDLFAEDVEALVNSVNCVGIMGRGIALQFKNAFPENFKAYAEACKRKEVTPGRMFVYQVHGMANPRYIVNFPTKRHWRGKSRMEDIELGLSSLVSEIRERDIRSVAIPPLGSDLGGLDWPEVRSRIADALRDLTDVRVVVFESGSAPADGRPNPTTDPPKLTQGRAALVMLAQQYVNGLLDPFVTLLEVHKLMYFLQAAGEPLKLQYRKGIYGPYAENLRHVLKAIEGHLTSGYSDTGDSPGQELELVPGAVEDAAAFLQGCPETLQRLERVSELVAGFESPFGLELLSTVHWVANERSSTTESQVIADTYAWGIRKKQFSRRQVLLALRLLREKNWVR